MPNIELSTLIQWAKVGGILWGAALVVVLLAGVRPFLRLIPDWLRSLSRLVVMVGTVAGVTAGLLVAGRLLMTSVQAQPSTPGLASFDLSFKSPDAFIQSLYLSMHQSDLNKPASNDPTQVSFVVAPGETASDVATRLQENGLVSNGDVFRRYMAYHGLDASLQAGTYVLRANMTMPELAEALQHGSVDTVTITIPEGWRAEQVGWLLEQKGLMKSDDFMAQVRTGQYDYSWLSGRPQGVSLEGFLFPDTYQLPTKPTPQDVVSRMLADFDVRAAAEIEGQLAGKQVYDLKAGAFRPMTAWDVVTLASLVEREAMVPAERPIIASVYLNRLDPTYVNETALRLSSDPTVQYAKGYDANTQSWWNELLPGENLTLQSPYNTYRVQGLPPGPICSPGLASIEAILNPAKTKYLYFWGVGDGTNVFATTLEEHLRNQQKYPHQP